MRPPNNLVIMCGLPFAAVTTTQAVAQLIEWAGQPHEAPCRICVTPNTDFIARALSIFPSRIKNPEFFHILQSADLVVADGMPLIWLSRGIGTPLPERVAGSDILPLIAAKASTENPIRLYFLGGKGNSAAVAAKVLQTEYPEVQIVGIDNAFVPLDGSPEAEQLDQAICERINHASPDLLAVGFGPIKQELWLKNNAHRLHVPIAIAIGGSFSFIAKDIIRAPKWMQRCGLEWLHRLAQEPGRLFKRYLTAAFVFGTLILQHLFAVLLSTSRRTAPWVPPPIHETETEIHLCCADLKKVDNNARAYLFQMQQQARKYGKKLVLKELSRSAAMQIRLYRLDI